MFPLWSKTKFFWPCIADRHFFSTVTWQTLLVETDTMNFWLLFLDIIIIRTLGLWFTLLFCTENCSWLLLASLSVDFSTRKYIKHALWCISTKIWSSECCIDNVKFFAGTLFKVCSCKINCGQSENFLKLCLDNLHSQLLHYLFCNRALFSCVQPHMYLVMVRVHA